MVRLCQVAPGKISVVYPAYDSGLYRAEHSEEKVAEVVIRLRIAVDYVLAIGTIHPRKNYALLMEAFAKLISLPRYRKMHLVIVGGKGWLYEKILAKARSLGLARSVRFLDYVPARDMPVLVSGARLLAFPSLHEGFGIPILEAQACGTPVVCSMTSSLPEAAGDGAVFVDPLDSDALCAAMERVMEDQALRGKLVRNGFENIKRFSWETSARQVLQIVRELE
jgi:glycosyltransferase involved in cell wall biosynthesis